MARKTKARALLDRQKVGEALKESLGAKKEGDGKEKGLKIKGDVKRLENIFWSHGHGCCTDRFLFNLWHE